MRTEIIRASFMERRRGYIGWTIGITLLVAFTFAFYPTVRDNSEIAAMMEQLPDSLRAFVGDKDPTSPAGYLESQLFLWLLPVMFFVYAIGQSADTIAGAEKRKTLDLLLAHPVSRTRVLLEKFAAIIIGLLALGATLALCVAVGATVVDMDVSVDGLVAVTVGCVLLAVVMGALSLAVAAATGKKGLAVAVASSFALASYFVHSLAPQAEALEAVQPASPFFYYLGGDPIRNGMQWADLLLLCGVTVVLVAIAAALFNRRDIDV